MFTTRMGHIIFTYSFHVKPSETGKQIKINSENGYIGFEFTFCYMKRQRNGISVPAPEDRSVGTPDLSPSVPTSILGNMPRVNHSNNNFPFGSISVCSGADA